MQNDVLDSAKLEDRLEGKLEGMLEGKLEGKQEVARNLKKWDFP